MSTTDDHPWRDELSAYLLGSLSTEEAAAFERHLAGCPRCRDELGWLRPAVDSLAESVPQIEPPAGLRSRLLTEVRADAARAGIGATDERTTSPRPPLTSRLGAFLLRPAMAFAVLAVIVAGAAGYVLRGGDEPVTTTAQGRAGVQATLEYRDDSGVLELTGLRQLRPSRVYQAWVQRDGEIEPSSLFEASRDGSATTALPHQLSDADAVMVTVEPRGGSREPSREPFISVALSD